MKTFANFTIWLFCIAFMSFLVSISLYTMITKLSIGTCLLFVATLVILLIILLLGFSKDEN